VTTFSQKRIIAYTSMNTHTRIHTHTHARDVLQISFFFLEKDNLPINQVLTEGGSPRTDGRFCTRAFSLSQL